MAMTDVFDYLSARIVVDTDTKCWLWRGARSRGYARAKFNRAPVYAHRLSWGAFVGDVPHGMQLDHLCRVRECVNQTHLEPVTARENTHRSSNPAARNAKKTTCANGHAYDDANTMFLGSGARRCKACAYKKYNDRNRTNKEAKHD